MSEPTRKGDEIAIAGDYQAKALNEGFVVQRFWHSMKTRQIDTALPPRENAVVLDLGCGSGVITNHLAERAAQVHAVDANPQAIDYARTHAVKGNILFHLGRVDEIRFEAESFDQVYCLELIEHLYMRQVADLLRHIAGVLKPGGEMLVTTPNYHSMWPVIEWTMDVLGLAPRMQGDQHVCHFTIKQLRETAAGTGLDVARVGRFCGLAPFVSVLSWKLALAIERLENRLSCPFGNLLYAVLRKSRGSAPVRA